MIILFLNEVAFYIILDGQLGPALFCPYHGSPHSGLKPVVEC